VSPLRSRLQYLRHRAFITYLRVRIFWKESTVQAARARLSEAHLAVIDAELELANLQLDSIAMQAVSPYGKSRARG